MKALGADFIQNLFAGMPEGGVTQIMPQGDGLGEILVQTERPRHGSGDLSHFERVGQPRSVMVPRGIEEHLGLMLESSKGF